jgi:hypothetical protein
MATSTNIANKCSKEVNACFSPSTTFATTMCPTNTATYVLQSLTNVQQIQPVLSKMDWQTQMDTKWGDEAAQKSACYKTCKDILEKKGVKTTSLDSAIFTAKENASHTYLNITNQAQKGIDVIDKELLAGHPIIVGVDKKLGNSPNSDKTTDHFVVIIGKGFDLQTGKTYYQFYDVGTKHNEKGTSDNNRLYLQQDFSLVGVSQYNQKTYTVSQVRPNQ